MAKASKQTTNPFSPKAKATKGKYSKKHSTNKTSKNYHKPNVGQG